MINSRKLCFFLGLVSRQNNEVGKKAEISLQAMDLDCKLLDRFCIKKEEKKTLICCSAEVSSINYLFRLFFLGF